MFHYSVGTDNPVHHTITISLPEDLKRARDDVTADDTGIPCQTLINLYLRDCAANGKKLSMLWRKDADRWVA